jgi:hypothetical protein
MRHAACDVCVWCGTEQPREKDHFNGCNGYKQCCNCHCCAILRHNTILRLIFEGGEGVTQKCLFVCCAPGYKHIMTPSIYERTLKIPREHVQRLLVTIVVQRQYVTGEKELFMSVLHAHKQLHDMWHYSASTFKHNCTDNSNTVIAL